MADVRVYDVAMAVQNEARDLDMHTTEAYDMEAVASGEEIDLDVYMDEAYDLELSTAVGRADAKLYDGPYEVTPLAYDPVILATKNKLMADDVAVRKVPYYETSNLFDGQTVYIAEDINGN